MNRPSLPLTRDTLGHYFNECGYIESGAEVGVLYGNNAGVLLSQWKGKRFYAIDAWRNWSNDQYEGYANALNMDEVFCRAQQTLAQYGDRVVFQRLTSLEAAALHEKESLDWIYIDANHAEDYVRSDVEHWWPKVRKGGVLCGHDYIDGYCWETHFGVKSAVDTFAEKHLLNVLTTGDKFNWFVFKDLS
jgi:hypothetical protein